MSKNMTTSKPGDIKVVKHGDYEIITPDTSKLRQALRKARPGEPDPVARAEQALTEISDNFQTWMNVECERLDAARRKIKETGISKETRKALSFAANDVKGNSGMLGFSVVSQVADSLCRLLQYTPDHSKIPMVIIDQHVDAVRAIVREYSRSDISTMAANLNSQLRAVTDEFLVRENQHRPNVLKAIQSPSIVPEDGK
jgi:hypothetical protein